MYAECWKMVDDSLEVHDDAVGKQNVSYTLKSEDIGDELKPQDNGSGVTVADGSSEDGKKNEKNEKVQMVGVKELVSSISSFFILFSYICKCL
jgi:hypothetical protein